jgi:hypothetical protein
LALVGDVVDRTFREYLLLPDDQPVQAPLASTVAVDAVSWPLDATGLGTEDRDAFTPGIFVECGQHLAWVTGVSESGDTLTLTVKPGRGGTTSVEHAAGAFVTPAPTFARKNVFDAVCDQVPALGQTLFRVGNAPITTAVDYAEVPADVEQVTEFWYSVNGRHRRGSFEFLANFPSSSTGKAIQTYAVAPGVSGHIVYRARFARPTGEASDLSTLGVRDSWERILVVGAAAHLVGTRALDSTYQAFVSEMLRMEGVPTGSYTRIRDGLLRLRALYLEEARRELVSAEPTPIVFNPVSL